MRRAAAVATPPPDDTPAPAADDRTAAVIARALVHALREISSQPSPMLVDGKQVAALWGRSPAFFYDVVKANPDFPRPVRLMEKAYPQWILSEVLQWVLARPRVLEAQAVTA